MDYYHLIYQVPAIVSGTTMLAYLYPRRVLPHFIPLLTFLVSLGVLVMPVLPAVALAVTPLVALFHQVLGLNLTAHEVLEVPKASAVRAKIRRPKVTLRQFVTRAYPAPGSDEPAEETTEEVSEESQVTSFIPEL